MARTGAIMNREEMLVEMLKKADEEIQALKEQLAFMHKELNAHYELLNAVGQAAFMGNH
jgi:hypothetical protein